jgi:hypothetical protein
MDDVSHVGLVDTHTECDSSTDDVDLALEPFTLNSRSVRNLHVGVVKSGFDSLRLQLL